MRKLSTVACIQRFLKNVCFLLCFYWLENKQLDWGHQTGVNINMFVKKYIKAGTQIEKKKRSIICRTHVSQ